VFKEIGFAEGEAERELLKADLAVEIYRIIAGRKLTPAKAGELLGADQADVSGLQNGELDRFSVERLFAFLNRLNRNVEVRITPTKNAKGHQRVVAV